MNLNNTLRRWPLVGPWLNQRIGSGRAQRQGLRAGVRVAANAVTILAGPYSASWFPGGRGIDRVERIDRGPGDWHWSVARNVRVAGRHWFGSVTLDRSPRWRHQYR